MFSHSTMYTVLDFLEAGKKIEAIKGFRALTGVGLKEAKDAVEAIEHAFKQGVFKTHAKPAPAPKPDPMAGRVLVVDSKNNDRVLGSIPRPRGNSPKLDGGDCYNMAVMRKLSVCDFDPYARPDLDMTVSHVRFGFRCVNWNVVLTTDAGIDLLTRIEDFRLPGEDAEQAHVRQMYAR